MFLAKDLSVIPDATVGAFHGLKIFVIVLKNRQIFFPMKN